MPNRYGSRRRRPRKLSVLEIFVILFWMSNASSPLAVLRYDTIAAPLSYASAGIGLIALAMSIYFQTGRIFERLRLYSRWKLGLKMVGAFLAAVALSLFALSCCKLVNWLMGSFSRVTAVFTWIVLGLVASYFGLQQMDLRDAVVVAAWLFLANLAVILFDNDLVLGSAMYSSVLTLWTHNYLLKCDIF